MLEFKAGNIGLARSMHSCAVKADPESDTAWEVNSLFTANPLSTAFPLRSELLPSLDLGLKSIVRFKKVRPLQKLQSYHTEALHMEPFAATAIVLRSGFGLLCSLGFVWRKAWTSTLEQKG